MSTANVEEQLLDEEMAWAWEPPVPDALGEVIEIDAMMSVFAAQRYLRIDALRREALADARVFRGAVPEIIERSLRLELASALGVTENAAHRLLADAEALVKRYPGVLDALARAATTERHARLFVELLDSVEPELRGRILEQAVELAETLPFGSFRRALRRLVDDVRAATLEERHRDALEDRRVVVEPGADGMAWLMAYLPAVEAHEAYDRLTKMAASIGVAGDERRTRDQLRADVLGDLLVDGRTDLLPEAARGARASVVVTVSALALLDDEVAKTAPATMAGVGPIPIQRARELCAGASSWMRVLTHPETETILSVGRDRYRPPPDLKRFVEWRAGRCVAPGCGRAAADCEIDHTVAYADGGRTEEQNLNPLCTGHHTVKHHGGWRVRQVPGRYGALEWTSPSGRRYVVEPERRVPVFRPNDIDAVR